MTLVAPGRHKRARRSAGHFACAVLAIAIAGAAAAQSTPPGVGSDTATGSPTFCLVELPPVNERKQWLNLVHVQYIEQRGDELRIYFGGGNLGSGHEVRLPTPGRDDAPTLIRRLQQAARNCR